LADLLSNTMKILIRHSITFIITAAIFMFCHVASRDTNLAIGMLH
jgi:hypothetical protein